MDAFRTIDSAALEVRLADFFATEAERLEIAAAYLFGSMARGTTKSPERRRRRRALRGRSAAGPAGLGVPLAGNLERLLGREVDVAIRSRLATG